MACRAALASIREKEFSQQVVELAHHFGWWHYRVHDSRRTPAGWPDLTLCRPPRLIFAELKVGRRKTTWEQQQWLGKLGECPAVEVFVWRPEDWSAIEETLR